MSIAPSTAHTTVRHESNRCNVRLENVCSTHCRRHGIRERESASEREDENVESVELIDEAIACDIEMRSIRLWNEIRSCVYIFSYIQIHTLRIHASNWTHEIFSIFCALLTFFVDCRSDNFFCSFAATHWSTSNQPTHVQHTNKII